MKTAAAWFEEGMHAIGMSRTADYRSEYEGDLERAVAAFDQALGLEPTHLGALRERGLALALLGQHEAALDSFVAAVAQHKDSALLLAAAQSLSKLKRHEEALRTFEQVLELDPADEEARFGRADTLMALGDFENGLKAWDLVLEAPDNKTLDVHGRRVRVLTSDFRRTHARLSRAVALAQLGRPTAQAAFRELLESGVEQLTGPSTPPALLDALGTFEVARAALREWIDAHANEPTAWRRAAQLWFGARLTSDSIAAWDRLIALAPDAQAWFGKAEAYVQAGKLSHAIHAYERALELWPGFLGAAARLKVVTAQRDAGRWSVMHHDSYAREDTEVGEFATKAEAEAERASLHASTGDHYWLVPAT